MVGKLNLGKCHRENSTNGKFNQWKIPPTENSTCGQIGHISKTKNLKIDLSFDSAYLSRTFDPF